MNPVTLPKAEDLGVDEKLTDDQRKVIEEEKAESWDKPPVDPSKEKKEAEPSPEAKQKEKEEEPADKKTPEEIEAEKQAQAADEATKKANEAESARLEKKAKELGKTADEVKKLETDEKAEQERIEKIAKEENLTVEEVKENELKDRSIADRHGKDPIKLARALRKEQSEYGKVKNEVEQLREFKSQVEANQAKFSEERFEAQMLEGKEDIITKYREKFPQECENLSDDAIFERGRTLIKEGLKKREAAHLDKVKADAGTKRAELIKNLPEEFKDFSHEVKGMIAECSDDQILDKEFDVVYLATYARGKKYTPDYVKSLEDAAYTRGSEKAKIIPKVPPARPSGQKNEAGGGKDLSAKQRERAEEIYGRREGWTKEQMWDEYAKNDKDKDF